MKKQLSILTLLFLFMLSCSKSITDETISVSMSNATIKETEAFLDDFEPGWYAPQGSADFDETTQFTDQPSLLITKRGRDASDGHKAYYFLEAKKLEGAKAQFEGKYKFEGAENAQITFLVEQVYGNGKTKSDSIVVENLQGDSDWKSFELKFPVEKTKFFFLLTVYTNGAQRVWTNDWKLSIREKEAEIIYGAEKDTEFDKGSNITLGALTPQMTENIEVLGKVWGFMKYYHPQVTKGEYNWDYELFRVLPEIVNAKDKDERNVLLNQWLDKYGKIKEFEEYVIEDSSKYSRILDLKWITYKDLFDEVLIQKLTDIRNAKRNDDNYYILEPIMGLENKLADRKYENITWEDQGFRIISLFRLWNAMQYNFPYLELTDSPWESVLKEFIPQIISAKSESEYQTSILKLCAKIDDSHGYVKIEKPNFEGTAIERILYSPSFSVSLKQSKEGDIVVSHTMIEMVDRGDIVVAIEGRDVKEIINEMKPYIAASNEPTKMSRILPHLLKSKAKGLQVTIVRNGKKMDVTLQNFTGDRDIQSIKTWEDYKTKNPKIAYLDVSTHKEIIQQVLENLDGTKGVILDMRKYPKMEVMQQLEEILYSEENSYVWFSSNEKEQAGTYKFMSDAKTSKGSPDYYKGKVVMLVNEGTQSHGEFSTMSYRTSPRSIVIGSQTAGADGNISILPLPGNVQMVFTALGTYYPNWELCQRAGIKIDIPVIPTNKDIKEGRDPLIEKAIEYIMK